MPVSGDGWQVRSIVEVFEDCVVAAASQEPTEVHIVRFGFDGAVTEITEGAAVHGAVIGGPTTVVVRSGLDADGTTVVVHREDAEPAPIQVLAEPPRHTSRSSRWLLRASTSCGPRCCSPPTTSPDRGACRC